jgi:hypothetical protein
MVLWFTDLFTKPLLWVHYSCMYQLRVDWSFCCILPLRNEVESDIEVFGRRIEALKDLIKTVGWIGHFPYESVTTDVSYYNFGKCRSRFCASFTDRFCVTEIMAQINNLL